MSDGYTKCWSCHRTIRAEDVECFWCRKKQRGYE